MSWLAMMQGSWSGVRQDFSGRLGRSLRDGLLFLGVVHLANAVVLAWAPTFTFNVMANQLCLDLLEHEVTLRRLALGTLLEGAHHLMTAAAVLSLALRSTWGAAREAYEEARRVRSHGR